MRRGLAEASPAAHLPDLAASLNNVGLRLSRLGRSAEALAIALRDQGCGDVRREGTLEARAAAGGQVEQQGQLLS